MQSNNLSKIVEYLFKASSLKMFSMINKKCRQVTININYNIINIKYFDIKLIKLFPSIRNLSIDFKGPLNNSVIQYVSKFPMHISYTVTNPLFSNISCDLKNFNYSRVETLFITFDQIFDYADITHENEMIELTLKPGLISVFTNLKKIRIYIYHVDKLYKIVNPFKHIKVILCCYSLVVFNSCNIYSSFKINNIGKRPISPHELQNKLILQFGNPDFYNILGTNFRNLIIDDHRQLKYKHNEKFYVPDFEEDRGFYYHYLLDQNLKNLEQLDIHNIRYLKLSTGIKLLKLDLALTPLKYLILKAKESEVNVITPPSLRHFTLRCKLLTYINLSNSFKFD